MIRRVVEALRPPGFLTTTSVVVILFLGYYAVEGAGKTVITEFYISDALRGALNGLDGKTLIQQLIVELDRVRVVHEDARAIEVNLVRGLRGVSPRGETLRLRLTGRLQADYNTIISSVDAIDWGPLKLPASAIMRPFQKLIRQRLVQVTLERDGAGYRLFASSDDGAAWVVTTKTARRFVPDLADPPSVPDLVRALAYGMAFADTRRHEPDDLVTAAYHFHNGTRKIVEYYQRGPHASPGSGQEILGEAVAELEEALAWDPSDAKSGYNLVLAELERAVFFPNPENQIRTYEALLRAIRDLTARAAIADGARSLLLADLVLLGEANQAMGRGGEALRWYGKALGILGAHDDLKAYVVNNMGTIHGEAGRVTEARRAYRQAIRVAPGYARAYLNLGNSFLDERNFPEAERWYGEALSKVPDYGSALYDLALLHHEMRRAGALQAQFADAQACVAAQARRAGAAYVEQLERAELVRNLTAEESRNLDGGRALQQAVDARAPEAAPAGRYGECLASYRPVTSAGEE